jgi:hypothetical protein
MINPACSHVKNNKTAIAKIFSNKPVLTIVLISIMWEPKTIALGGVAVGSIKAIDDAIVAGNISNTGFVPLLIASAANTGNNI